MTVSGMTDLQIIEEALRDAGITREHISARKDQLRESYIREMKRAVRGGALKLDEAAEDKEVRCDHVRFRG
jgi:hypothetical protein